MRHRDLSHGRRGAIGNLIVHIQTWKNEAVHTTGTCAGTHTGNMTVEGDSGNRTGTAGIMSVVPTRMKHECTAATVVAHWQWQVGTTRGELMLWHMANLIDDCSSL